MSIEVSNSYEDEIERALGSLGVRSVRVKPGRWLVNGSILLTTSHEAEDWLTVEGTRVAGDSPLSPWGLVLMNRSLPHPARLALGSGDRELVRADVSLSETNGHLAARLKAACVAVQIGCGQIEQGEWPADGDAAAAPAPVLQVDLAALCREAGWTYADRDGGRIVVTIDVPGEFVQATVEATAGGVRFTVELLRSDGLTAESREAIGLLLLAVSRTVRGVRPSASEQADGGATVWLEVELEGEPSPAMLDRALSCQSLAAAQCCREIGTLVDARVATGYLAAQGRWFPDITHPESAASRDQARDHH